MKKNPADKVESWPIDKLVPYARNARTHSDAQVAQLAASITEWGWTTPILVEPAGGVIAGHGRLMAARKLGLTHVPVMVADGWSEAQRRAYVLADNKLAMNAGWDDELLQIELGELGELGFDLELAGFDLGEIEPTKVEPQGDPDETPEPPAKPKSVPGDVWILGDHRVMCGDSTSVEAVDTVTQGKTFDLCFTSPPYALGKSASLSGNKAISAKGKAYDAHEDSPTEWPDLMDGWWSASVGRVSAWAVNVQPLAGNKRELFRWIGDRVERLVDVATWDKGHAAPQMAQGVMTSRFEWILIFGDENASRVVPFSSWHGNVQNVYDAPPQRGNEFAKVHGATMPVHLAEWAIGTLCDKAKTVFEPFGGTGTTLIACEKLGKACAAIEISPAYVDVIVKRWQDYTGKKATHAESGKAFDEVS
jgi:DNA modification methylase